MRKRSIMSLKRTLLEPLTSSSHVVKMYPMEPFSVGSAFIEYVVLNIALGDLEMLKCSPRGTLKSRMAAREAGWATRPHNEGWHARTS